MTMLRLACTAFVALLAGCMAPSRRTAEPPVSDLAQAAPLTPLFRALDAIETGTARQPVTILQIGDSHTANDAFSGRLRSLMQARFGDAGRGMLPPGIPFRYYRPAQVSVTATGWHATGSLLASAPGPFGLAGVRQTATGPAEMTLTADQPDGFDHVLIEALGQPGGGTIQAISGTAAPLTLRTDAPAGTPLWLSVPTTGGELTLRTSGNGPSGNGPVTLLSWTAESRRRGVTWSNLGTIGATIDTFARFDPALVRAELDKLRPALILVAFGTNEGFNDAIEPASYQQRYAQALRALHEAAPAASILVIGPPDGNRRTSGMACPTNDPSAKSRWSVPPRLPQLREAQREVAIEQNAYYWDWSAAMGGPCSMQAWARTAPPMGAADHVHLLTPGYQATADRLFQEIMRHYDRFRERAHPG